MSPNKLYLIWFLSAIVESKRDKHKSRKGRTVLFNVLEDNIKIDLEFTVPFISIPIKKSLDSLDITTININPASLAFGGAIVLGTTVLLPLLAKNYASYPSNSKYTRILDNVEFGTDPLLNFASEMVSDHQSLRACVLRISCWAAQRNHAEPIKFFNNILRNDVLSNIINSTAIEDALISGINGKDCMEYTPCPLDAHHLSAVIRSIFSV